jgi:lactate permease
MAAIYGLIASLLVATVVYKMPVSMAGETAVFGAAFGLMPIGSIILNVIFLYQLTLERGYFKVLQDSIAGVSQDRRLQLLLIAFCFIMDPGSSTFSPRASTAFSAGCPGRGANLRCRRL